MEPQLAQGSPKRKESSAEEREVQLEDVRTLLKEERQCFNEEMKSEIKNLSTSMTQTLERFQGELGTVSSKVEGIQQTMEVNMARVGGIEKRLGAVENRSTTLGSEIDGERRRALILGGWDEQNAAATTLDAARSVVQQLRLDLDMGELFVPGARRGYARAGESEAQWQERLRGAIECGKQMC